MRKKKLCSIRSACVASKALCALLLGQALAPQHADADTRRYRLSWRADPATTMVVGWEAVNGNSATVYYDTDGSLGTNWSAYSNSRPYDVSRSSMGMVHQHARLTGLQPDTDYYFVIRDSNSVSQRFIFRTAPDTKKPFSVIAGGDSRNNRTPRQNANRIVSKIRPLFVAFGGDYTNGNTSSEWANWLDDWQLTKSSDGRLYPIMAARGNHDDNTSLNIIFDTPNNQNYFALSFANDLLRAYTLNSEISAGGTQGTWLENDLAAEGASATFRLASYHKPMRPHARGKSEGTDEYNNWAQKFYLGNVDLVVESDSHMVKRTFPIRPSTESGSDEGFIRDDATGTYYIGEGCWGAPLRSADDAKNWTNAMDSFNQCNWIQVHTDRMEVRTIKVDNAQSVAEVSDNNPFAEPNNIDIWTAGGRVLTMNARGSDGGGDIYIDIYEDGQNGYNGTQDTFVRSASPDTNYGNDDTIDADGDDAGGPIQGLLRFDGIIEALPANANVLSASLELEIVDGGSDFSIHRMLTNWDENSTWNSLNGGVSVDGSEAASVADVSLADGQLGTYTYNVTSAVQAWANGDTNYGWVIVSNGTNGVDFPSSDGTNPPKLSINYEAEEETGGETLRIEAEDSSAVSGNHIVATNHAGYSGTGFVDYGGEGYVEWTFTVDAADYEVRVGYALPAGSRPLDLSIDGVLIERLSCAETGGWATWGEDVASTVVSLGAGSHTLRLTTTGASGANVDYIDLVNLGGGDPSVDTTPPSVSFVNPTTTVVEGSSISFEIDATDNEGISRVYLYKDGVELPRSEGAFPYEFGLASQNDPDLQNLAAGTHEFRARAVDVNGNEGEAFVTVTVEPENTGSTDPIFIEAEDFVLNVGYRTQTTTDVGGGQNLAYATVGDYVEYNITNVSGGQWAFVFRIASVNAGAKFDVSIGNTVIATVDEPPTGGNQTWVTTPRIPVTLPSGDSTIRITANVNSWNLNWFEIVPVGN